MGIADVLLMALYRLSRSARGGLIRSADWQRNGLGSPLVCQTIVEFGVSAENPLVVFPLPATVTPGTAQVLYSCDATASPIVFDTDVEYTPAFFLPPAGTPGFMQSFFGAPVGDTVRPQAWAVANVEVDEPYGYSMPACFQKRKLFGPCWGTVLQYPPVLRYYYNDFSPYPYGELAQDILANSPVGAFNCNGVTLPISAEYVELADGESYILMATGTPSAVTVPRPGSYCPQACFCPNKRPEDFGF